MKKLTLADLAAKPLELELKHPSSGEPLGMFVTIVGKNSTQFRNKFYDIIELAQAQAKDDGASNTQRNRIAEVQAAELIAECIIGWSDNEFFGGEYSIERAFDIVSKAEFKWVKDQIDTAIADEGIFFIK